MDNREHIVVGAGEILWDLLPEGKRLGGAPANFAYHAKALGERSVVVSSVGSDEPGKQILSKLDKLGLGHKYIKIDTEHLTGTVTVKLDENGSADYIIHRNVAWDFIPLSTQLLELAAKADAVCFGSLCQRSKVSRGTIKAFLAATHLDCIRIFDINLRQSFYNKDILHSSLKVSDVLKLNIDEFAVLSELFVIAGSESDILAELLRRYNLRLIALTRGSMGSRLYTREGDCECKAVTPAKIVDTVGAGDCFTAALAVGLLRGYELDKINYQANRIASFVCSQTGATPKLPKELANYNWKI